MSDLINLLAVLAGALTVVVPYTFLLRAERDRVNELLRLFQAKVAPAEFAAYMTPHTDVVEDWLFTDDGLVGAEVLED